MDTTTAVTTPSTPTTIPQHQHPHIIDPLVTMVEESGKLGLFLRHSQGLELVDAYQERPRANSTSNSISTSLNILNTNQTLTSPNLPPLPPPPHRSSSFSHSNITISTPLYLLNGHHNHSPNSLTIRRYELNPKLFAIHEPYLMKSERESIVKMMAEENNNNNNTNSSNKKRKNSGKNTKDDEISDEDEEGLEEENNQNNNKNNNSGEKSTADKTAANRSQKRKKALTKKANYLGQNLCSEVERKLATKIIDDCLISQQLAAKGKLPNKSSPSKTNRKRTTSGGTNSSSSSQNSCSDKTTDQNQHHQQLLLRHINTSDAHSNAEAQLFVQELFKNRFESLNYRGKVLCNPYGKVIKVKFGLSNYLIPARCSFAGADITEGITELLETLRSSSPDQLDGYHLNCRRPFIVVMDPAWANRSVKRKKTYETVTLEYLRRMCRELRQLLDLVVDVKLNSNSNGSNGNGINFDSQDDNTEATIDSTTTTATNTSLPLVLTAIWTTKADKDFVTKEMLPLLGLTPRYELKWHKVTNRGCPVKIHGGLEFLIIAERCWPVVKESSIETTITSSSPSKTTTSKNTNKCTTGLLVSVPSAIHSHKPSVLPLLSRLYGPEFQAYLGHHRGASCSGLRSPHRSPRPNAKYQPDQLMNYHLAPGEVISPLVGVELFARYLQSGFHSIGYECIKLQNEALYTWTESFIEG